MDLWLFLAILTLHFLADNISDQKHFFILITLLKLEEKNGHYSQKSKFVFYGMQTYYSDAGDNVRCNNGYDTRTKIDQAERLSKDINFQELMPFSNGIWRETAFYVSEYVQTEQFFAAEIKNTHSSQYRKIIPQGIKANLTVMDPSSWLFPNCTLP